MINVTELLAWLEQQIGRAEKEYAIHAGNQTACQLHKDGRITGGLKYDEGRLVAFTTLRRIVRKSGDGAAGELRAPIEAEQARWQAAIHTYRHAPQPSIPWIAYNQGGVDALTAALAHFTGQP
jgi:hypothetical protein